MLCCTRLAACTCAVVILGAAVAADGISTDDAARQFMDANAAYENGEFAVAVEGYEQLISAGSAGSDIYYNLGNAYLKQGAVGKALLNFKRAQRIAPRDEDIRANIAYVREQTRDEIECRQAPAFLSDFCFWYSRMNLSELTMLFIGVNALLWLVLAARIFIKRDLLLMVLYAALFLATIVGASTAVKAYAFLFDHSGIVVAPEIMVRSGKSINDTVLFKLHEGAAFSWRDEGDGWVKIKLCDGKKGWVQKETVEKI